MARRRVAALSKRRRGGTEPGGQALIPTVFLSELFPSVSHIVINMTYYRKGANPVLMKRMVNVCPTDSAHFNMKCAIKGCDGGGFDLTSIISKMVKSRKKAKKGGLVCSGNNSALAADHASIAYEIGIRYK